jgi:hypothetical protein
MPFGPRLVRPGSGRHPTWGHATSRSSALELTPRFQEASGPSALARFSVEGHPGGDEGGRHDPLRPTAGRARHRCPATRPGGG